MSKLTDKDKSGVIDTIHYLLRVEWDCIMTKRELCEFLTSKSTIYNLSNYYHMINPIEED
jgi:hypothetical protein